MLCFVCVLSDMTSEDQTDRIQQLEKRIEELENKQQLSKISRRGILGGIAGLGGLGAMSGSGAAASGQVGTANNRVNVVADDIDANTLSGSVKNQGCRVILSASQTVSGTRTKIQFDAQRYDSDGNFNTSSHNWTCPEDGLYMAHLQVNFEDGANDEIREITIGTATSPTPVGTGSFNRKSNSDTGDRMATSTINKYSQGDTIAGYAAADSSQTDLVSSGTGNSSTFLEVAFLGGL